MHLLVRVSFDHRLTTHITRSTQHNPPVGWLSTAYGLLMSASKWSVSESIPDRYRGDNWVNQPTLLRCSSPEVYHNLNAPYKESLLPSTRITLRTGPDPKHVFIRLEMMHHYHRQPLVLHLLVRTGRIEIVSLLLLAWFIHEPCMHCIFAYVFVWDWLLCWTRRKKCVKCLGHEDVYCFIITDWLFLIGRGVILRDGF